MARAQNLESLTLVQSLSTLTTAVSTDLSRVANRSYEEGLVARDHWEEALLQTKTSRVRATELVGRAIDQISLNPKKFQVFLDILEESQMFSSVVKEVWNKYTEYQVVKKVLAWYT